MPDLGLYISKEAMVTAIAFVVLLLALFGFIKVRKKRKEARERKAEAVADSISMRRAAINTKYLEKMLFEVIESVVIAKYTQNPNAIVHDKLDSVFYDKVYNSLKKEYDNHVRRQVFGFEMTKARVIKQDNSSMYTVTHLTVEGNFKVDQLYMHPTLTRRFMKEFTQQFVFMLYGDDWKLKEIGEETNVVETDIQSGSL